MHSDQRPFKGLMPDDTSEIFEAIPIPLLVLDPQYNIVGANQARLRATNTTLEETVGQNLFIVFPDNPNDLTANGVSNLRSSLDTVLKTKRPHRMPTQRYDIPIQKNGEVQFEEKYWSPFNFPILNPDGSVKFIIHQVEDVTEEIISKKQVATVEAISKAIDAERLRLLSIFQQAPIGICLMRGPEFIIEYANRTYHKIAGEKRIIDGLPAAKAFADIGPEATGLTMKAYQTGNTIIKEDLRVTTDWDHSGTPYEKIFLTIFEPLIGQDGKSEGVITLAYDDTDKIRAGIETKKMLLELKQEREIREKFVATLAHDLRTPLTAVKISAQLVKKQAADADSVRKYSNNLLIAVERCDKMITDLLDANRISAGKTLPIEVSVCSLKKIAQETLEELTAVHGERFDLLAPNGAIEGRWSCSGIRRILENLCSNAIKYGSKQTRITVKIEVNKERASISVQNWGSLILPEDQSKLFNIYSRVGSEQQTTEKGWGLGLTLVKGITEALKGSVSVESSLEKGTIFTVTLPYEAHSSATYKTSSP